MKRILYVLIAFFTISFSANATAINVVHSSASELIQSDLCDPSDLILGPIAIIQGVPPECADYTFSVPAVFGCPGTNLNGFYTFVVTDASGNTIAFIPNTQSTSLSVTLPSYGQYFVHVQYSYVDVNGVGQSVTVLTDFDYQGCVTTPCHPNSLSLGPISVTEMTASPECSDYTISVPPISGCQWTTLSGYYSFAVYDDANNLIGSVSNTQSTSFPIDLPYDGQFSVVVQYHYTDINGVTHEVTETTSFSQTGCDCNNIQPPTGLSCVLITYEYGVYQYISWDPAPNAVSYEIERNRDDPKCCPSEEITQTHISGGNVGGWIIVYGTACNSRRVRSVCADGTKSEWSELLCSCLPEELVEEGSRPKSSTQFGEELEAEQLQLIAAPNPAVDQVDITFSGFLVGAHLSKTEMAIYDMKGKVAYSSEIMLNETKTVDLSSFESGVYIISIVNSNGIISSEKLIVE